MQLTICCKGQVGLRIIVYSRTQIPEFSFSCKQDVLNPRSSGRRLKCVVKCTVMCTEALAKRINFLLSDYTENDILELLVKS